MGKDCEYVVTPIDLKQIKRKLHLTNEEMGSRLKAQCYDNSIDNDTYVGTRVSEWMNGHRSTPDYIYRFAARMVLDIWSEERHAAAQEHIPQLDKRFGSLLSPMFGDLLSREHELSKGRNAQNRALLAEIRKFRRMKQKELEKLLDIKMGYVFAAEPGGFDEDAAGETL